MLILAGLMLSFDSGRPQDMSQITPPVMEIPFVVPESISVRNLTRCPHEHPFSAEFEYKNDRVRTIQVSGDGRLSNSQDMASIDKFFDDLRGLNSVSITCQKDGSAFIDIFGTDTSNDIPRNVRIIFRWSHGGAIALP